jgi:hypothetical protein
VSISSYPVLFNFSLLDYSNRLYQRSFSHQRTESDHHSSFSQIIGQSMSHAAREITEQKILPSPQMGAYCSRFITKNDDVKNDKHTEMSKSNNKNWSGDSAPPEDKNTFDNSGDVKSGPDCTEHHNNIQKRAENIENITSQKSTIESQSSISASPGSPGSPMIPDSKSSQAPEALYVSEARAEFVDPIRSVEAFFSNDISLDGHSIESSPCYPIIGSRPGEISTDTVYYCKLHPDNLGSTFLSAIENHCRDKEPDIHKAEILRLRVTDTEHDITQQQHDPSQGESA